jgi:hypothetical protein
MERRKGRKARIKDGRRVEGKGKGGRDSLTTLPCNSLKKKH